MMTRQGAELSLPSRSPTLGTVQPELRPQARILKTLNVQGFLNHYFAALLECFKIMLERQFLISHSLYDAENSQYLK